MKRVFYVLLAVGLAFSLAGCQESGGGYWPANPVAPTGTPQPTPLGNTTTAATVLGVSATGVSTSGGVSYANSAVGGCAAIADFISLPGSVTGAFAAPSTTSIKNSIMAAGRSKSKATELGMTLEAVSGSDYTKFTHETSGTDYSGMSYTTKYTYYVQFLNSTGSKLTLNTSSTDDFWSFTNASYTDVDGIKFYGEWEVSAKGTVTTHSGSSSQPTCSIQASTSSTSSTSEFTMMGTLGTADAPCYVAGLLSTDYNRYANISSKFSYTGKIDGQTYAYNLTNKLSGDSTYNSNQDLFYWNTSSSTNYYGYGTQEIVSSDGTTIKMVAEGSKYSVYVNGTLVYSYPSTSSNY